MERNKTLDVIKGFCCLLVIATHFDWSAAEYKRLLFAFWLDIPIPPFMIISGYVGALSARGFREGRLADQYAAGRLCGKLLRFLVPFTAFFLLEFLAYLFVAGRRFGALELLRMYLVGGVGPGSYYTPIMLQFVFAFPLIYAVIRKHGFRGLLLCGGVNAAYELLKWAYGMNDGCYRLLVFRYILLIAYGCYLALNPAPVKRSVSLASFFIGVAFIVAYQYLGYEPVILNMWTYTCFVSALYVLPVIGQLIRRGTLRCRPLELLGRASYNVYLMQMLYYCFGTDFVYRRVPNRMAQLAANLILCAAAGLIFHRLEEPVTKRLTRRIVQT